MDFVEIYSKPALIHLFYMKGLKTLKHQLVFLFSFFLFLFFRSFFVFVYYLKGEYANLACFFFRLRLKGNVSSPAI